MNLVKFGLIILAISFAAGCELLKEPVIETSEGYQIKQNTELDVVLQTPLSSNTNNRGDQFVTNLAEPLMFKNKPILPKGIEIRGLVKRVSKYEKLGDRASLLLLFDQIVFPDGRRLPIEASLDTEKGQDVLKIKGKIVKDATIIGGSALVGTLAGKKTLGKEGEKKGLVVGTVAGAGAVILSNMREVSLPNGTELIVKLDEPLLIPSEKP